jgi:L-alanine-DL-glutamate epimerase-like enolase superfamily enzyme
VVRPDVVYFGGMIRAMRVARMAAAAGLPCILHMSGSGLGYLYQLHFVSALPNAGPYPPPVAGRRAHPADVHDLLPGGGGR